MTQCEIRGAGLDDMPDGINESVLHANSRGSWVMTIDGIDVGIGGFEGYPGGRVYQAWAYPNDDMKGHGLAVVRMVREKIAEMFIHSPFLTRIQAHAHECDREACRFALACGFTPESIMERAASDGHGMVMFRILRKEH